MATTAGGSEGLGGSGSLSPSAGFGADPLRRPRRRWAVLRRAIRHEISRLHDRRRILAMTLLIITFGSLAAGIVARGEPAGADARAYWAAVRIWIAGGDPYRPTGPFLPYVYAPWMLPVFAPWALLPWDVAWYVWRGGTILVLLWGAIFVGPALAGIIWAMETWMKWVPIVFLFVLAPRARLWGLLFLMVSVVLSLATLPGTVAQLEALVGFGRRPIRLDYLVFLWALVPVMWRRADPFAWLRPSWYRSQIERWRFERRSRTRRVRTWLGLPHGSPADREPTAGEPISAGSLPLVADEGLEAAPAEGVDAR